MPDMNLRQHEFTYSVCRPFAKKKTKKNKKKQTDKVLHNKAFKIADDPKYDGYQRRLASVLYKILTQLFLKTKN